MTKRHDGRHNSDTRPLDLSLANPMTRTHFCSSFPSPPPMPKSSLGFAAVFFVPLVLGSASHRASMPATQRIFANDNRSAAGVLRNGVLTVRLEVREGEWHPERESDPGIAIRAFAEQGKGASVPGPLIRVPEGTEIHASVRNTLTKGTVVVRGLSTRGVAANARDSLVIPSGESREVSFSAGAAGTYFYQAVVSDAPAADGATIDAELSGAFVIDPRGAPARPKDRVFVLGLWTRTPSPIGVVTQDEVLRFTINGKSWPHTERLFYPLGDTVHFRLINTSVAVHPMHLHGFYFTVDSRGNGVVDSTYGADVPPYRVVTERLAPLRTATMTWVPERAGNWLFHCHDNFHIERNQPLDGGALPTGQHVHVENHAMEMMGGLVMGIAVQGADRSAQGPRDADRRRLRLVARPDTGGTAAEPFYGYALDEPSTPARKAALLPGPTLLLKRNQPVAITVVNELPEPTAVHWHGIELESYFDGVAGFAGQGKRIAPVIVPRDSFIARFTPPRSGTFIYHPHADEVRQQTAGMSGALLVVDDPATYDASHDIVLLVTTPRRADEQDAVYINGSTSPPAIEIKSGEKYRIRLINIHTYRPSMVTRIASDTATLVWRPIAKDGMDIPAARSVMRRAVQQMGNGETFDFEFVAPAGRDLRLTVSSGAGVLLAAMPIRVR